MVLRQLILFRDSYLGVGQELFVFEKVTNISISFVKKPIIDLRQIPESRSPLRQTFVSDENFCSVRKTIGALIQITLSSSNIVQQPNPMVIKSVALAVNCVARCFLTCIKIVRLCKSNNTITVIKKAITTLE